MAKTLDDVTVPPMALGHVRMDVKALGPATDWFADVGLRVIARHDTLSVLELRGGTHLVLRRTDDVIAPGTEAPLDLMVDDLHAWHADCGARGLQPGEIASGTIHDSFYLPGPDGSRVKVTSSHTGGRAV